jgi:hypothetical protein
MSAILKGEIKMTNKYREELVLRIKEAGQELIDRAEQMISKDTDAISDFSLYINLNQVDLLVPTIEWSTSVISKNTLDRMREEKK